MRRSDILSGCFLVILGLVTMFVIIPAEITGHSDYGLAPDFFPRLLIWLLILLSALLVVHRLWLQTDRGEEEDEPPMPREDWLYIAGMSIFLAVAYFAMERIGFIVMGIAAVALLMAMMGGLQHMLRLVLVAAAAPVLIYLAFDHLFTVFLP